MYWILPWIICTLHLNRIAFWVSRLVINPCILGVILGAYPPGCAAFAGVSPNVVADESVMKTDEGMRMEQRYTVVSFLLQSTILFWL